MKTIGTMLKKLINTIIRSIRKMFGMQILTTAGEKSWGDVKTLKLIYKLDCNTVSGSVSLPLLNGATDFWYPIPRLASGSFPQFAFNDSTKIFTWTDSGDVYPISNFTLLFFRA